MVTKIALVSTVRTLDATTLQFVRRHIETGFDELHLYVSEPGTDAPDLGPNVYLHPDGNELRSRYMECASYSKLQLRVDSEVMARQLLNAEDVLARLSDGVEWLVHLDGDELLWFPTGWTLQKFFSSMPASVGQVIFANFESCPTSLDSNDPLQDIRYFKINPLWLSRGEIQRFHHHMGSRPYFHSYVNGKAAVRVVGATDVRGVHLFGVAPKYTTINRSTPPVVLHFAEYNFATFLSKYEDLGAFDDVWLDDQQVTPFRKRARDTLINEGAEGLRKLYSRSVALESEDVLHKLVECGVIFDLENPEQFSAR